MDTLQFMNMNMATYSRLDKRWEENTSFHRVPPKFLKVHPLWNETFKLDREKEDDNEDV